MPTPINPESKLSGISDITRRHLFAFGMKLMQMSQDVNLAPNAGEHFAEVTDGTSGALALLAQLQVLDEITRPVGNRGRTAPERPVQPRMDQLEAMPLRLPNGLDDTVRPLYLGRDDIPQAIYVQNGDTNGKA